MISSHFSFLPHIREAAREVVSKLQLDDRQQDRQQDFQQDLQQNRQKDLRQDRQKDRQQDLRLDKKQQDTFYVGVHVRYIENFLVIFIYRICHKNALFGRHS